MDSVPLKGIYNNVCMKLLFFEWKEEEEDVKICVKHKWYEV